MLCLIYQAGYMARDRQSRNRRAAKSIFSGGVFWVFLLNAFRERSTCPRAPSRAKRTVIFGAILVSSSQVARGGRRGTRARWASARASHARPPGRTRRWVEGRDRSALSVFSFSDERPVSGHIGDTVTFRKSRGQRKSAKAQKPAFAGPFSSRRGDSNPGPLHYERSGPPPRFPC